MKLSKLFVYAFLTILISTNVSLSNGLRFHCDGYKWSDGKNLLSFW